MFYRCLSVVNFPVDPVHPVILSDKRVGVEPFRFSCDNFKMKSFYIFTIVSVLMLSACLPETTRVVEKQIEHNLERAQTDPHNAEVRYRLGRGFLTLGRYEQGASHLKDAVRLNKAHALAHRELGWALYHLKDYTGAEPWLLRALEMMPRDRATLSTLSAVYIHQKRYRDAVDLLKPFVDTGRGTVKIGNNLAVAYQHLGLYRLAMKQLKQSLEKNPDSAETHSNLGVLLEKVGKPKEALAEYEIALTLDPGHGSAHFNLAVALTRQEKIDEGLSHFRMAHQAHPHDPEILAGLGWTYQRLERYPEAIRYYEQSVRLSPSNIQVQQALGELWDITRQYGRAVSAYEMAAGLDPEMPDNYYHLGRLSDHLKAGDKAVAYMAAAEALYRKNRNAEMAEHCRKNIAILAAKYHLKKADVRRLTQSALPAAG